MEPRSSVIDRLDTQRNPQSIPPACISRPYHTTAHSSMSTPHPITPNVPPLRSQNLPNIRLDPFRFLNSHWNSEFEPWYWIFHILSLSAVYHQKYDTGGNKDGVDIPSLFNSVVGELNTADPGVLEYQDSHAAAWRDRKMRSLLRKVLWCDAERKKNKEVMGDRWCRKNSEEERFRRAVHVDHFLECLKIWVGHCLFSTFITFCFS